MFRFWLRANSNKKPRTWNTQMAPHYKLCGCLTWAVCKTLLLHSLIASLKSEGTWCLIRLFTFSIFNVRKNLVTFRNKSCQLGKPFCNIMPWHLKCFSLMVALFLPEESYTQEENKKRRKSNKEKKHSNMTEVV